MTTNCGSRRSPFVPRVSLWSEKEIKWQESDAISKTLRVHKVPQFQVMVMEQYCIFIYKNGLPEYIRTKLNIDIANKSYDAFLKLFHIHMLILPRTWVEVFRSFHDCLLIPILTERTLYLHGRNRAP